MMFRFSAPDSSGAKGSAAGMTTTQNLPDTTKPGVGNKAIALKNCRNVTLRDFSILQGGWFGILATGVDNLTIDNLKIDTNRDGMDIDCCRSVRVSNCTVNSPWDDGICPKSSFALGYARATESVTITNCYVTGGYELGSLLDGSWKPMPASFANDRTGRIKCGTESNGGFVGITVSNCVFESSRGLALETRGRSDLRRHHLLKCLHARYCASTGSFLPLGKAPARAGRRTGWDASPHRAQQHHLLGRVHAALSILSGLPGFPIEDIQISNAFFQQRRWRPSRRWLRVCRRRMRMLTRSPPCSASSRRQVSSAGMCAISRVSHVEIQTRSP